MVLKYPMSCMLSLFCSKTHNSTFLLINSPSRDEAGWVEKEKHKKSVQQSSLLDQDVQNLGYFYNQALTLCSKLV